MTIAVTVNTLYLLLQIWASFCFIFDYIGRYSGYSAYRHEVSSKNTAVNSTVAWQDRFDRFDRWYYGRITYTHRKSILTRLSVYVSAIRLGQTAKSATGPMALVSDRGRRRFYPGFSYGSPAAASLAARNTGPEIFITPLPRALQNLGSGCHSARHPVCQTDLQSRETRLDTAIPLGTSTATATTTSTVPWRQSRYDTEDKSGLPRQTNYRNNNPRAAGSRTSGEAVATEHYHVLPTGTAIQSSEGPTTFLLSIFHSPEAGQETGQGSSCTGIEEIKEFWTIPERLCDSAKIQNGRSSSIMYDAFSIGLDHDCRPDGGVHDYPPKPSLQYADEVSMLQPRGCSDHISDESFVLWPRASSMCFHEILGSDSRLRQSGSWDTGPDSTRRYYCSESVQTNAREAVSISGGSSDLSGIYNQKPEMQIITVATAGLEWSSNRLYDHGTLPPTQETSGGQPERAPPDQMGEAKQKYYDAAVRKRRWTPSFMPPDGATNQTTDTVPSTQIQPLIARTQMDGSKLGWSNSTLDSGGNKRTRLVGNSARKTQWTASKTTTARPDHGIRRFGLGSWSDRYRGLSAARGSPVRFEMALHTTGTPMAYNTQGAGSAAAGHHSSGQNGQNSRSPSYKKSSMAEQDRQSSRQHIYKQAGWQKTRTNADGEGAVGMVSQARNTSYQRIHDWRRDDRVWRRPAEQRNLLTNGVEDEGALVPKTRPALGSAHDRRLCIGPKPSATTFLLTMEREKFRSTRRTETESNGRELVLQSTSRFDTLSARHDAQNQRQQQIENYRAHFDNTSPPGMVHTSATGNVNTAANSDRGPPAHAASGARSQSKTATDVLEFYGLETLYQACTKNGLTPVAAQFVLSQWRTDKQLPKHCNTWNNYWVPYCAREKIDPIAYTTASPGVTSTSAHLTNCIAEAQTTAAEKAVTKGKAAQHSILKLIRAAVSAFMQIIHPDKPELTFSTYVRKAAKTARLVAPMAKRYNFCFDISLIFNVFALWYDKGFRNKTMPLKMLRAKSIMLSRIQSSGRSDDMTKIFREIVTTTRSKSFAGLFYKDGHLNKWRYHRPKNVSSLAGHSSSWVELGPAHFKTEEDTEKFCTVYCNECYLDRTTDLAREPVYTEDGDGYFPFYIAFCKNKNKNYAGIGTQRVSKDIIWIMQLAGIDTVQFKAHVIRHASLAAKRDHGIERDIFLASAKMSGAVYDKYYNVPILRDEYQTSEERRAHYARQYGMLEKEPVVVHDAD